MSPELSKLSDVLAARYGGEARSLEHLDVVEMEKPASGAESRAGFSCSLPVRQTPGRAIRRDLAGRSRLNGKCS
jgi:hypothetical protein